MPNLQVLPVRARFSIVIVNIAILTVLLGVGCSRTDLAKDAPAGSSTSSAQGPTTGPSKEQPADTLTQVVAREQFTGDLDGMVKRRIIRVLVVPDRATSFGIQTRGIMYEALREFEAGLNKKLKTGNAPVSLIFLPVDRDKIINAFAEGRGDVWGGRPRLRMSGRNTATSPTRSART